MILVFFFVGLCCSCVGLIFFLHDWYVVIDSGSVLLRNTLGDPDDIAILLLLELQERVEHAEAELSHERVQVHFDLLLEEAVLDGLVARVGAHVLEESAILGIVLRHHLDLVVLLGLGQLIQAVRVEFAAARVQFGALVLGQLDAK